MEHIIIALEREHEKIAEQLAAQTFELLYKTTKVDNGVSRIREVHKQLRLSDAFDLVLTHLKS